MTPQIQKLQFKFNALNNERTVRILLPKNYQEETKHYRVIYMHDGQNVFEDETATFGESWKVPQNLGKFADNGGTDYVVVAIDNSAENKRLGRYDEYSPWHYDRSFKLPGRDLPIEEFGGLGDKYLSALVDELKPYIDKHYRTLTDRESTAIVGSSMGGLISLYGALKHPNTFGLVGVFSPAFWFNKEAVFKFINSYRFDDNFKIYMDIGTKETSDDLRKDFSEVYLSDACEMKETLAKIHSVNLSFIIDEGAVHNEKAWSKRFVHMLEHFK